jgi:thioredoxin-like negative regulator of GroEL
MPTSPVDAAKTKQRTSTPAKAENKPHLLFFYSPTNGPDRRVEGFLAQVLQRRRNHDSFAITRIDITTRADLAKRFRINDTPTILVVTDGKVRTRFTQPTGPTAIQRQLQPWLR